MPTYSITDPSGRTLELTGDKAPTEAEIDNVFAEYFGDVDEFEDERTVLGQAGETLKAIPRGFANSFLGAGEGLAELADAATNVVGLEDLIDSGDENALVFAAREGRLALDEYMGADEAYRDTWLTKFGEGVGSMASYFTPATAVKLAGMAGKTAAVVGTGGGFTLAGGSGAGDQAQRIQAARDSGIDVSEGQEDLAVLGGTVVGLSEMYTPTKLLKRLSPDANEKLPSGWKELLSSALRTGSGEAVQEVTASIAQNAIEKGVYNEDLELLGDNLYDDFTIGGAVGATADLVMNAVAGRRNTAAFNSQMEAEKKLQKDHKEAVAARQERIGAVVSADLAADERRVSNVDLGQDAASQILAQEAFEEADAIQAGVDADTAKAEAERSALEQARIEAATLKPETIEPPPSSGRQDKDPLQDYAQHIRRTMGESFPSGLNAFTSKTFQSTPVSEGVEGERKVAVVDSNGQQYGTALNSNEEAARLAGYLNDEAVNDAVFSGGEAIINSSADAYSPEQVSTLQAYNMAINDPNANLFTGPVVDSAAETTLDRGFDELGDVEELIRLGVPVNGLTASQKINKKRLENNLPKANSFTLDEVLSVLKPDQIKNLADPRINGTPETETYRVETRVNRKGRPIFEVKSSAGEIIKTRPTTKQEQTISALTNKNKQPRKQVPFASEAAARDWVNEQNNKVGTDRVSKGILRATDVNVSTLEALLQSKNISSPISSPEMRYLAKRLVGYKGNKPLSTMSQGQLGLFYTKLRALPRFDVATKLPVFAFKPYTNAQFKAAVSALNTKASRDGASAAAANAEAIISQMPGVRPENQKLIKALKADILAQGLNPQMSLPAVIPTPAVEPEVEETVTEERAPVIRQPAPIGTSPAFKEEALNKYSAAMKKVMTGFGLQDVPVAVDYALRNAVRDADGNLVYGVRRRKDGELPETGVLGGVLGSGEFVLEEEIDPDGTAQGYFTEGLNQIFLSVDRINRNNNLTEAQIESELASVLSHEMIHAMRALDLFTQKEWSTLSSVARSKKKAGNQSYLDWATKEYENDKLSDVSLMEEAIAEMVRDSLANPKLVQGKPRALLKRMTNFLVKLRNALNGSGFTSFEEIISNIGSGTIGGRERGVTRSLVTSEKRGNLGYIDDPSLLVERGKFADPDSTRLGIAMADEPDIQRTPNVGAPAEQPAGTVGAPRQADFVLSRKGLDPQSPEQQSERLQRAREQGYDTSEVFYHGTQSNFEKFESSKAGRMAGGSRVGFFFSTAPSVASGYAVKGAYSPSIIQKLKGIFGATTPQVMPVYLRKGREKRDIRPIQDFVYTEETKNQQSLTQLIQQAKEEGFDSYTFGAEDALNALTTIVFEPQDIRSVNAQFDPQLVDSANIMFSRGSEPLSPLGEAERMGMTNTDLLPTPEELDQMKKDTYQPEQKRSLVEAAQLLQDRWEAATGRTEQFEYTSENIGILSDMLASEALVALENDSNAIGWYDRKIKTAKEVMRLVEPKIMASPENEAVFDFVLAVTSNGQAVVDNFELATEMFRFYTRKGRLPSSKKEFNKGGERNKAMLEAFNFHNAYLASGQNQALQDFLDDDFTVKELKEVANQFNEAVGFKAMKIPSAEGANVVVKGSYVLGPKIGQGFYQNIRGNYDPLTMDIWWMRMWNRAVGRPFKVPLTDSQREERRVEIAGLLKKSGGLPKQLVNEVLKGQDQPLTEITQDPDLFDQFIRDLNSRYQRFFKDYKEEKGVNHDKPVIFQKVGTYVKNLSDQLQATPKGVVERAYMRTVVEAARERLAEAGFDITTADFQALMWYPEKQLFRALGVQPGRGSDNDYLDAAEILADKEGVPRGKVEKALRDADRKRTVDGQSSARGQDGSIRTDASRPDSQEESPAFSRREPTLASKIIPEGEVDRVVEKNKEDAINASAGFVPTFNPSSDPYAQAVAADPAKGAVLPPEEKVFFSRANSPELPANIKAGMDAMISASPDNKTPGETYLDVLDQGPIDRQLTEVKQGTVFRYAQIENYKDKLEKEVLASSSAMVAAMDADRSSAMTASALTSGSIVYKGGMTQVEDFDHTFSNESSRAGETKTFKGLIDVMGMLYQNGTSYEEIAQTYAIARRAGRLKAEGIDSPGNPKIWAEQIRYAESILDADGNSIIKDWYEVWNGYNSKTIQFLKDTGVLDDQTAEIWANQSDYVPFYRQAEGVETPDIPSLFGGLTASAGFKAIKGSEKQVNVPLLDAITMNLDAAVGMGMRNVAQQRIVRDMVKYGLSRELKPKEVARGELVVTFKVNGKTRRFTIDDPLVYESMQPLVGGAGLDLVSNILGKPANLLREMVTRDPGFIMANMMRDTLSAYVTSGSDFIPIYDTLKGFAEADIEQLERRGIVGGYDYSKDPSDISKYLNDKLKERGYLTDKTPFALKPFIGAWNALGGLTTRSDAATRKAVYEDVLARTGDDAEATFQAKEVMNFGRRGAHPVMRVITTAIPFLNARLQGLDLLLSATVGKRNANKQLSRGQATRSLLMRGSMIAASTALYFMLVSDDEQYEQTDEIKDNNWLIPTPWGVPFKFPIPFEVGLLFKVIPERALALATGRATGRETVESLTRGAISTLELNPLGVQATAPLVEAMVNYSFFTGRSVTPVFVDMQIAKEYQDLIGTTEMAKLLGQTFNMSPIKVDYVMRGYTGTLGAYVIDIVDTILKSKTLQGDNRSVLPARGLSQYPVIKRFLGQEFGGEATQRLYEMSNEVNTFYNTFNKLAKEGREEDLRRFSAGREHLIGLKSSTDDLRQSVADLRKYRRFIQRSDMTAAQKQAEIREIDQQQKYLLEVVPQLMELADLPSVDVGSRLR